MLVVPVTLAVKACVASRNTVTELGVTVTLTLGGVGVEVDEPEATEPPPQPQTPIAAATVNNKLNTRVFIASSEAGVSALCPRLLVKAEWEGKQAQKVGNLRKTVAGASVDWAV